MNILTRTPPRADHRIAYGTSASQFGDLWLPSASGLKPFHKFPVVVFFHGGWWQSIYDLNYGGHLCAALKAEGVAVWSVEYRRLGSTGGGWPATFQDAAAGFDYLSTLAKDYPLDLTRVVAMGHSAGAHLAFWLAGRHHIEPFSPIHDPQPRLPLHGLISLAGAVDLRLTVDLAGYFSFAHDKQEVFNLMGGSPRYVDDRYRSGNPGDLLPLSIPQVLIQGSEDSQIPAELPARWAQMARKQGDEVTLDMLAAAGHFDVVDPQTAAWSVIRRAVRSMMML